VGWGKVGDKQRAAAACALTSHKAGWGGVPEGAALPST